MTVVYAASLQAIPDVIQQLCDTVADEDVEVASRAAGVLETVRCGCILA